MKLTVLINRLQNKLKKHGNVNVVKGFDYYGVAKCHYTEEFLFMKIIKEKEFNDEERLVI